MNLSDNAKFILEKRYLMKKEDGTLETPEELFRRVAKHIASVEKDKKFWEEKFYEMMVNLEALPNTPCLINSGRSLGMLSACFNLPIMDHLADIFETVKKTAIIFKAGGGVGINFSPLRPKGSNITTTAGTSSGAVSFMKVFDVASEQVKQGGCLSFETLVSTSDGLVRMDNYGSIDKKSYYKDGLHIKVSTDKEQEYATSFFNNGKVFTKTLTTKCGFSITGTPNHKLKVVDNKGQIVWKELKDIKVGEWMVLKKDSLIDNVVRFTEFNYNRHFNSKECTIPLKLTPELAEFVGLFIGDGHYLPNGFGFSVADKDKEVAEYIKKLASSLFGLTNGHIERQISDGQSFRLVFHNCEVMRWLQFIGIANIRARQKIVPDFIMRSDRLCIYAFLRGLFEADGCCNKDTGTHIKLDSSSIQLITQVQQLLLSVGIVAAQRVNIIRNSYSTNSVFYSLRILMSSSKHLFLKHIGFISEHKKTICSQIKLDTRGGRDVIPNCYVRLREFAYTHLIGAERLLIKHYIYGTKSRSNITLTSLKKIITKFPAIKSLLCDVNRDDLFYDRVCKVSRGKNYTVDLVVPTTHTYIANGFISHNTRRGAFMGILDVTHPEIFDFIRCKTEEGQLSNFNISVAVTDKFMEAVEKDDNISLHHPFTKEKMMIKARDLWKLIIEQAWKNGEPGVIFIDRINEFNPTPSLGLLSVNPCAEANLLPNESCNLGSINLTKFVSERDFDWDKLEETVRLMVRFLDDIIDVNKFPLPEIEKATKGNRKIGLGMMGWADCLILMGIKYNSKVSFKLADKLAGFIKRVALETSKELALEKGAFPNFEQSIYWEQSKKGEKFKLRNASLLSIAPTGSLSAIAGVSSGIEPNFAWEYVAHRVDTTLKEIHPLVKKYWDEKEELPEYFITASQIPYQDHIKMQSVFQRHVCMAISKTINMPNSATVEDISGAYKLAWESNCKGITVYREGSRKYEMLSKDGKKPQNEIKLKSIPKETDGKNFCLSSGCGKLYINVTLDSNGKPLEVFTNTSHGGCPSNTEAVGRLASMWLRAGLPIEHIVDKLKNIKCPSAMQRSKEIRSCPDGIATVLTKFIDGKKDQQEQNTCPSCKAKLVTAEGCISCQSCGFTKCSG